jgi:hypothetical protein
MTKRFTKNILQLSLIILLFSCLTIPSYSQTDTYIDGKLINTETGKPVPFATVVLKIKQLGVYANADGDFKIINNTDFQTDSLIISCIGFRRSSVAFRDLIQNRVNEIRLSPSVYSLAEVKVQAKKNKLNSFAIISKAISSIRKNFPMKPFNYISYYRDYQKRDGNYINLNEAIIQTLDGGFSTRSVSDKYRLLDFRKNIDFPRLEISPYYESDASINYNTKNIPYAILGDQNGNELFILMVHDALRNYDTQSFSFVNTFNENFLINHKFSDPVAVYNNNLLLYKIPFIGKEDATRNFMQVTGAIYIQPKDYTIHKLEYTCLLEERGEKPKPLYNIDIEYGYENSVDSLMCLKYISFNNLFNITDKKFFKIRDTYWTYTNKNQVKKPVVTIEFNRVIDSVSSGKKANYIIKLGQKVATITNIKMKDKNKVLVELQDENFSELLDSCIVQVKNIRDIAGNTINKKKDVELYQFRELFVQQYNKPPEFKDDCFIQYIPLDQNCISRFKGAYNYWMNTPENIKKEN